MAPVRQRREGASVFVGLVVLAFAGAPAVAQPSLQAAMLYGDANTVQFERVVPASSSDATPARAPADTLRDPWLGRDKAMHAGVSFLLTLSAQYVLVNKLDASEGGGLPIAAGATLSLGLAKEVADSQRAVRPLFSVRDLTADAIGVALAVGLVLL